ncbi:phospholipase D family protein [Moraxella oblonga]|uniref:phospholipase D family protein n=1 Tax=Moraxella oblonga TaxID=200413 RepID=UPI00082CFCB0|nr:phospholipase D family protein [Moraxella oblonga]
MTVLNFTKKWIKRMAVFLIAFVLILVLTALLTYKALPDHGAKSVSEHIKPNPQGAIASHLLPALAKEPQKSGIYPLANSRDAFLARLALIETASQSIDLQYYIYHDDISGRLLSQRLLAAADRGVRVRLLLDDHTMAGMDGVIAALDDHDNIEVRLFNPYMQRGFRPLGYLSDFFRLNRRMHNKSLTADSLVSILGGRNIGDEYFEATSGVMFADLDVAVVGKAVDEMASDFDRYWNSKSAYEARSIIGNVKAADLSGTSQEAQGYIDLLTESAFMKALQAGDLPFVWADATLISDHPDKVIGKRQEDNIFAKHIAPLMSQAQDELIIVSPYFVPTRQGERMLSTLAGSGKSVHVLTNTLAANDVAVVHSGYAKYRKELLKNGVNLYELKDSATVKPAKVRGVYDGKGASLHAKTFTVDNRYLYVGSFNFDPRSANLNTELGLLIDNPQLASVLSQKLHEDVRANVYEVKLDDHGKLHWYSQEDGQEVVSDKEPQSSLSRRIQVWIASRLPIEWLL